MMKKLVILLLALTSCSLLKSNENYPDIPGKLVFSAKDDKGTSQIFTMNANGSDLRKLTNFGTEGGAGRPAWSPDGTQIVFENYTGATTLGPYLYVMDTDGDNMHPLKKRQSESVTALIGSVPAWSPDGTKIAYQVCTNCELGGSDYEIAVVEVAGKTYDSDQVHSVTDHPASDTYPSWSPDSEHIAFSSGRDYFDANSMRWREDLYVIDIDGKNLTRLTETGNATRPVWSPNGSFIAYEWGRRGNNVYLYELSTSLITRVNSGLEFSGSPMWNSDGSELLVSGRESEEGQSKMKLLDIGIEPFGILQKIALDANAIGRGYNWYSNE